MKGSRLRKPLVSQLQNPYPREAASLTTAPERAQPLTDHVVPERADLALVLWNGVIGEIASDDLSQPFPLFGDRLVHAPSQLLPDFLGSHPHAVTPCPALQLECAATRATADMGEAEEVEGFRFTQATPGAPLRCEAASRRTQQHYSRNRRRSPAQRQQAREFQAKRATVEHS